MSAFTVHKATLNEVGEVHLLDNLCFTSKNGDTVSVKTGQIEEGVKLGQILLAKDGNRVVGFIQLEQLPGNIYHIVALAVLPSEHGRGIGKRLLSEVMVMYRMNKKRVKIFINVSPKNFSMIHLLQGFNFEGKMFLPDFHYENADRILFEYVSFKDALPEEYTETVYIPEENINLTKKLLNEGWRLTDGVHSVQHYFHIFSRIAVS